MEFFEVLERRKSTRRFKNKAIEVKKLLKINEAASLAPSAGNIHASEIFVIEDRLKRQELSGACFNQRAVREASAVFVFCANPEKLGSYGEKAAVFAAQDATIAATFAMLAATALGMSCVWVGAFDENEVIDIIDVPKNLVPVVVLPVGYAAGIK